MPGSSRVAPRPSLSFAVLMFRARGVEVWLRANRKRRRLACSYLFLTKSKVLGLAIVARGRLHVHMWLVWG